MSHRLFIALRPPEDIRQSLLGVMGGVRDARWQKDDQLHLTLAYLGEVDRHGLNHAVDGLSLVSRPRFGLELDGIGSFQSAVHKRTSILWAGVRDPAPDEERVKKRAPLPLLATTVRQAVQAAGLPVDARKFAPHITLARFGRLGASADSLQRWISSTHLPALPWSVDSFHLMESWLGAGGSHYETIASFSLQDGAF